METLLQDLRYAARQLRKHPAFTLTAILTLALGIGANTAIFTVVQSVLLAPLPYTDASRIMALDTHFTDKGRIHPRVTGPDAVDVRSQAHSLEAVSLYNEGLQGVQLHDHAVFTPVTIIDASFARVFGLVPIAGRTFTEQEIGRAALVSERFARDQFGSAEVALGQTVNFENEPLQITGVLPSSFDFPDKTQVWVTYPFHPEAEDRTSYNYKAVAKLRAGVSVDAARSELATLSQHLTAAYPGSNKNKQVTVVPLQDELTGAVRPMLLLLLAAVAMILLIACVNVTHLMLARSIDRQRELAVRTALGSSRSKLRQLVLAESLLISLTGGVLGILLAVPVLRVLLAMAPADLPRAAEIHLNGWVLAFTLALSLLTTVLSSLFPARKASKTDPAEALKVDSSRGITAKSAPVLRNSLVVAEVAATFLLAVGAALLLRTMMTLMDRDLGYQPGNLLVVNAEAPGFDLKSGQEVARKYEDIFAQLKVLPGVESAAGIFGLPEFAIGSNGGYSVKGVPTDNYHMPWSDFSVVTPGYFTTMKIPLLRGRDFSVGDKFDGQLVAIISESVAKQSFGNADPIGKQIQLGLDLESMSKWITIIGVAGDVRQDSPASQPGPNIYMPMAQHPSRAPDINIVLRTKVPPLALMNTVQAKIQQINPQIAMHFTTMDAMVGESIAAERFRSVLIASFAGVALLLAMLGVYGTMAYSVAQRTFEIGVRMAFGAEKKAILRMVIVHAAKLACWGIGLGLVLSFALTRLMTSMLVGVRAIDPLSLAVATALLLTTAAVAALAPAWRAAQVDPMAALRAE
ncbi:ABC transporter permease [Alloacidobacterium sp.]|uniref:ABC transporter permease n=1 Tax=Alloacidobacterium sp. TaxID=2951999 RepID=UPI002D4576BF|nr:ABC transporter permease [Alloacidobacterium sp.]HYK37265.1 ABC transporter permease [Alloacidobacterium sp.]